MCLYITSDRLIAENDIECLKVLDINLRSWYQKFQYAFNRKEEKREEDLLLTQGAMITSNIKYYGTEGFHSYSTEDNDTSVVRRYYDLAPDALFVKCIIPKGSVYYCGVHSNGLKGYMSNAIIPVNVDRPIKKGGSYSCV